MTLTTTGEKRQAIHNPVAVGQQYTTLHHSFGDNAIHKPQFILAEWGGLMRRFTQGRAKEKVGVCTAVFRITSAAESNIISHQFFIFVTTSPTRQLDHYVSHRLHFHVVFRMSLEAVRITWPCTQCHIRIGPSAPVCVKWNLPVCFQSSDAAKLVNSLAKAAQIHKPRTLPNLANITGSLSELCWVIQTPLSNIFNLVAFQIFTTFSHMH